MQPPIHQIGHAGLGLDIAVLDIRGFKMALDLHIGGGHGGFGIAVLYKALAQNIALVACVQAGGTRGCGRANL